MPVSASSPKLWTNFLRPSTPPRLTEWELDYQSAGRSSRDTMAAFGRHATTAQAQRFASPSLVHQRVPRATTARLLPQMPHENSVCLYLRRPFANRPIPKHNGRHPMTWQNL